MNNNTCTHLTDSQKIDWVDSDSPLDDIYRPSLSTYDPYIEDDCDDDDDEYYTGGV